MTPLLKKQNYASPEHALKILPLTGTSPYRSSIPIESAKARMLNRTSIPDTSKNLCLFREQNLAVLYFAPGRNLSLLNRNYINPYTRI